MAQTKEVTQRLILKIYSATKQVLQFSINRNSKATDSLVSEQTDIRHDDWTALSVPLFNSVTLPPPRPRSSSRSTTSWFRVNAPWHRANGMV
jgi:hypothetical protein